ncbi:Ppx/GppA phosphatase family protein [Timonella senegalensis]|uniref:Ppx/GppA phosphatase family protein n=1 Tax=Timonella senegalensis TaxID=1465825 RepID=UPI0002D69B02|nr:Ppx/GppA phosphatase family protein [Timonella senegalensis]
MSVDVVLPETQPELAAGSVRVAAIDCGTNSIRLLVADIDRATGAMKDHVRLMEVVRLGQGVDQTGRLAEDALERTFAATRRYAEICAAYGVERIRFVATSATRDAENRDVFVSGVKAAIGVEPEVVSGEEEAELSFAGAVSVLGTEHTGPYLVVDLGGGSTELVLGTKSPVAAYSMNVGCVRMTERHLNSDPPTAEEIEAAARDINAAIDEASKHVPIGRTATLVGLAGTITTVTAHALKLRSYDREQINGAVLPLKAAQESTKNLMERNRAERAALPFMHPGRVDVIGAGALVWSTVMARVQAAVAQAGGALRTTVTSEHDILDGIALSLAR